MATLKIFVFVFVTILSISEQVLIEEVRVYDELNKCTNDDRASCILFYQLIHKKCKDEQNSNYCLKVEVYKKECDDFAKRSHCIIYKCAEADGMNGHCMVQFMWQHQTETIAFFVCLAVITFGLIFWCCKRGCWGCCKRKSGVTRRNPV